MFASVLLVTASAVDSWSKMVPNGQGCHTRTRDDCCPYVDGRKGHDSYFAQPCVPSQVGEEFSSGNTCEPACWVNGGCSGGSSSKSHCLLVFRHFCKEDTEKAMQCPDPPSWNRPAAPAPPPMEFQAPSGGHWLTNLGHQLEASRARGLDFGENKEARSKTVRSREDELEARLEGLLTSLEGREARVMHAMFMNTQSPSKRKFNFQGCWTIDDPVECCKTMDGRSGAYFDQPCVPSLPGQTMGGRGCQPKCWADGTCGSANTVYDYASCDEVLTRG